MLLSPAVGHPMQALGAALRYGSGLACRAREMATLLVARPLRQRVRMGRARRARPRGWATEAEIASLRTAEPAAAAGPRTPSSAPRWPARPRRPARAALPDAERLLGQAALFELVVLVGYYRMLAAVLAVFRIPAG